MVLCLDPPAQVILDVGAQILEREIGDFPTIVDGTELCSITDWLLQTKM